MEIQHAAVIDIGSNSLRLLEGIRAGRSWQFKPKQLASTRLGRNQASSGKLDPEGLRLSMAALAQWHEQLGAIPVLAVATSAVREASDGAVFMAAIEKSFGWQVRILTGEQEAALSFCGAASSAAADEAIVVMDIGGGSTEIAAGANGQVQWSHSYPLGAVRLALPDRPTVQDIQNLEAYCQSLWLPMDVVPQRLLGVGGTLTSLAAIDQSLAIYDPAVVDGYVVSTDCIGRHIDCLSHMTPEQRRHVVGLQPARADIIVSGLIIAQSFLIRYGLSEISISEGDLLEGIFRHNLFI